MERMSPVLTKRQYQASCHCQSIRYSVILSPPLDDIDSWVIECNCSICARNGYLNVYVANECIEFESVGLESELVSVRFYHIDGFAAFELRSTIRREKDS
jgi:hypothetical protein